MKNHTSDNIDKDDMTFTELKQVMHDIVQDYLSKDMTPEERATSKKYFLASVAKAKLLKNAEGQGCRASK